MTSTTATAPAATQPVRRARFWEIDALRGVAIITMIVYHTMWDLWYWGILPDVILWDGFWKYWQRFTAGTFLILVGVSMTIVYRRERARRGPDARIFPKFLWRGLRIFGLGLIVGVFVQVAGIGYDDFGILHLIGIATILGYPFLRFKWLNLGLWVVFSLVGKWIEPMRWDGVWYPLQIGGTLSPIWIDGRVLAPIGVTPTYYPAIDYFPLIPWFGVVLLGIWFGNWFYMDNTRRVQLPDWGDVFPITTLEFLGRHALIIYLIHQPIILAVLFILGIVRF